MESTFSADFLRQSASILERVDIEEVERLVAGLAALRQRGGRLFILGVGGSAGHAGHAVNDFRKICDIEAYAPTDNVSELTGSRAARTVTSRSSRAGLPTPGAIPCRS